MAEASEQTMLETINALRIKYEEDPDAFQTEKERAETTKLLEKGPDEEELGSPPNWNLYDQALTKLATWYTDRGKFDKAEELFQTILEIRVKMLGNTNFFVVDVLTAIARIYRKQSKFIGSAQLLQRALDIGIAIQEAPTIIAGNLFLELGIMSHQPEFDMRDLTQSKEYLLMAMDLFKEQDAGEEDHDYIVTLLNIAIVEYYESYGLDCRVDTNDPKSAMDPEKVKAQTAAREKSIQESRDILAKARKIMGNETEYTAECITTVACMESDSTAASKLFDEEIAIREKIQSPHHCDIASANLNLSKCLSKLNKHEEALNAAKRAYQIYKKQLGGASYKAAKAMAEMGEIYLDLGDARHAQEYLKKARNTFADIRPNTLDLQSKVERLCADLEVFKLAKQHGVDNSWVTGDSLDESKVGAAIAREGKKKGDKKKKGSKK